jgi:uncharacterized protein YggL (DUF469 family)
MRNAVRRYNKRQMKKKHLGEFQELGFMVEAQMPAAMDEQGRNAFLYRFIRDAVEANGLAFGGGMGDDFSGFVVSAKAYGKVEESARALVQGWLEQQGELKNVVVGPLRDAWYGWG